MIQTDSENIISDKRTTVLLAGERELVRKAWRWIFREEVCFHVIAECGTPESAILQAKKLKPAIIVQEIKPPGLSGIEAVPLFQKFSPGSKILGVSRYSFSNIAKELLKAGITGFITKTTSAEEMLQATKEISEGKNYVSQDLTRSLRCFKDSEDPLERLNRLSISEIEVLIGMKNGVTCEEIAQELNITTTMVEIYRYHILKKLRLMEAADLSDFLNEHRMAF